MICCDAVPDFVGDRFADHSMSVKLNEAVLLSCNKLLRESGTLLMKIIEGPYSKETEEACLNLFQKVKRVKPSASRNESREIYFLCTNYLNSENPQAKYGKEMAKKYKKFMSGKIDENSEEG